MWDWLTNADDFMPRHLCGKWTGPLAIMYVAGHILIALAYMGIPIMLVWNWKEYRDSGNVRQWQVVFFAAFILFCGGGHILDGPLMFFWPNYRFVAVWHLLTAIVSWGTLLTMPHFVRRFAKEKP